MTYEEFTARYKFDRKTDLLGKGGFGTVYKAYDDFRNSYIAIKIAEVDNDNQKFRLLNEFQRAKSLPPHSNIAHYEECFTFNFPNAEYDYALMQYYEAGNLQQLLVKNKLTVDDKISLLKDILNGIELLHRNNVIHRDLKPENILIGQRPNGSYVPKIADFGISKVMDENKTVGTNTVVGGTFSYSSPEQLVGGEIRKNTDLWSFGILVCRLFTGRTPFHSGSFDSQSHGDQASLVSNILNAPLHSDFLNMPSPFNKVVELCLVKESVRRVKDASELKSFLQSDSIPITVISDPSLEPPTLTSIPAPQKNVPKESKSKLIAKREFDDYGLYGFVDEYNRPKIPFTFYSANNLLEGLALVSKDINSSYFSSKLLYGFIDEDGKTVIDFKYEVAKSFSEGLAAVRPSEKWGFIDKNNKVRIEPIYTFVSPFKEGLSCVILNNKTGFINSENDVVIPFIYDYASPFSKGRAVVMINYNYGVIDKENKIILPLIYSQVAAEENGMFKVCLGGKWGFVDKVNNGIIPVAYQAIGSYNEKEGLIKVSNGNKIGYINIKNELIIDFQFIAATDFINGKATVTRKINLFKEKVETLYSKDYNL